MSYQLINTASMVVTLEAKLLKTSPADIRKVCCVRLHSENSEPTLISPTTPEEHPPTPPPCRWPALFTLPTLCKFQLVWRRLCHVLFRSSCLFGHTLTTVCALPEYQSCRKYNVYSNILWPSKCPFHFWPDILVSFWSQAGPLRRECPPRR